MTGAAWTQPGEEWAASLPFLGAPRNQFIHPQADGEDKFPVDPRPFLWSTSAAALRNVAHCPPRVPSPEIPEPIDSAGDPFGQTHQARGIYKYSSTATALARISTPPVSPTTATPYRTRQHLYPGTRPGIMVSAQQALYFLCHPNELRAIIQWYVVSHQQFPGRVR